MSAQKNPPILLALMLSFPLGADANPVPHEISGDVDTSFFFNDTDRLNEPPFEQAIGWVSEIRSVLVQDDGKIIIGSAEAQTELAWVRKPVRLHVDGTIDPSFETAPGVGPWPGESPSFHDEVLEHDSEGRVLVGTGQPFSERSVDRQRLARRLANGALDPTFTPPDNTIGFARLLSDGRIITQLTTSIFGDNDQAQVVRLDPDGQLAFGFDTFGIFGESEFLVDAMPFPDDKILVASANRLRRLNSNGSLDPTFANNAFYPVALRRVLLQSTGKIILIDECKVSRLQPDGTVDPTFASAFPDGSAPKVLNDGLVDAHDRVLVCGMFWNMNFHTRPSVARLLPDGVVDPTIFAGTEIPGGIWHGPIPVFNAMALQKDGNIILVSSGNFDPSEQPVHPVHMNVIRLYGDRFVPNEQLRDVAYLAPQQSFQLEAPTFGGRTYLLERNRDLRLGGWEIIDAVDGNGTDVLFVDREASARQNHYRLRTVSSEFRD